MLKQFRNKTKGALHYLAILKYRSVLKLYFLFFLYFAYDNK